MGFHTHDELLTIFQSFGLSFSFEEMRIRYERREPRPEDIRRIDELKSVVDSQEQDIYHLTEQLRELQLQLQQQQQQQQQLQNNQINQQNSNQSNKNRNRGRNNKNNRGNSNVNAQQMRNNQNQQQQHQPNDDSEHLQNDPEETPQPPTPSLNVTVTSQASPRMRPPPLIKTVIYEEENENELYEEQLREERERQNESIPIPTKHNDRFTVELVPESPDRLSKTDEEISEALIVSEHEVINQRVVPSPTPDDLKKQEIAIEVISTIEPSHIQIIPVENGLDLELD